MVRRDQADLEEMVLSVLFMILMDITASIVPSISEALVLI